jgi:hypothetical protein
MPSVPENTSTLRPHRNEINSNKVCEIAIGSVMIK